jgi:hypothetical protein
VKVFTVLLVLFSIGTLFTVQSSYMPSQETSTSTITTYTWGITVSTDKSTYSPGETVVVSGTVTGAGFLCGSGTMCTTTCNIIIELEIRDSLNAVVYSKSLNGCPARLPDEPPIISYSDSFNLSGALMLGRFQVNARATWNGYPTVQASSSFQLEGAATGLSVNFDKTTYYAGDTVHIAGCISTPYCTWTYGRGEGLAIAITIYDPNGLLVLNSTSNPSAAIYKYYAYEYVLPASAVPGTYSVAVSYSYPCGGDGLVSGQGTFQVFPTVTTPSNCSLHLYNFTRTTTIYATTTIPTTTATINQTYNYNPGQTVHIVITYLGSFALMYPTHFPVHVYVYDPMQTQVYHDFYYWTTSATTTVTEFSYEFDWTVPMNASLGVYAVRATAGDCAELSTSFQVVSATPLTTPVTTPAPPPGPGIPGFSIEAILVGLAGGLVALILVRRRRSMSQWSLRGEIAP